MTASPNRLIATIVGALYLAFGLLGFTVTTDFGFVAPAGGLFLGFVQLNGLQNLVHIALGFALVLCGLRGLRVARFGNSTIGTLFLVFGLIGLFVSGSPSNIVAVNGAGNALHFGTAIVLLVVSLGAEKRNSQPKGAQPASRTR